MLIIPSIYIQKGKCVSLYKGREDGQKRTYPKSPLNRALEFQKQGASLLHLTDLDGSHNHGPENIKIIRQIVERLHIPVEVAGGIRDLETIRALFEWGVARVVIGVSAREIIPQAIQSFGPDRIVFGIKARQEKVESDLPPESDEVLEIAEQMVEAGVTQIVYKDMERIGTLFHPNYDEIERLIYFLPEHVKIISCGGVVSLNDLHLLAEMGTHGVIIGRAFMEHKLSLGEAVETYQVAEEIGTLPRSKFSEETR